MDDKTVFYWRGVGYYLPTKDKLDEDTEWHFLSDTKRTAYAMKTWLRDNSQLNLSGVDDVTRFYTPPEHLYVIREKYPSGDPHGTVWSAIYDKETAARFIVKFYSKWRLKERYSMLIKEYRKQVPFTEFCRTHECLIRGNPELEPSYYNQQTRVGVVKRKVKTNG